MSYGETAQRCFAKSEAEVENDCEMEEAPDAVGKMIAV